MMRPRAYCGYMVRLYRRKVCTSCDCLQNFLQRLYSYLHDVSQNLRVQRNGSACDAEGICYYLGWYIYLRVIASETVHESVMYLMRVSVKILLRSRDDKSDLPC